VKDVARHDSNDIKLKKTTTSLESDKKHDPHQLCCNRKPERQMRKASHCNKINLVVTVRKHNQLFSRFRSIIGGHSLRSLHRDHSVIACSRHVYMVLFFAHIPFVVNRAFSATPMKRLQQLSHMKQ